MKTTLAFVFSLLILGAACTEAELQGDITAKDQGVQQQFKGGASQCGQIGVCNTNSCAYPLVSNYNTCSYPWFYGGYCNSYYPWSYGGYCNNYRYGCGYNNYGYGNCGYRNRDHCRRRRRRGCGRRFRGNY